MIIPKDNRKKIYSELVQEGVLVAPKDFEITHPYLGLPNLQVVKAAQSLTSRGYLKTQFSWQWYYYTLTPEGLDYLREFLHLPAEVVPATHKRPARAPRAAAAPGGAPGAYRPPRPAGGDREYRRKDAGAPEGDYRPRFSGNRA